MKIQDRNNRTSDFELEGELFPAFRKARAVSELRSEDTAVNRERPENARGVSSGQPDYKEDVNRETKNFGAENREEDTSKETAVYGSGQNNADKNEKNGNTGDADEEKVPAIFGDVCLDKYKVREVTDHEPTLLEFLNEPVDDIPLPRPSLFEGIGREYYVSDEVRRLAEEAEALEKLKEKSVGKAGGDVSDEDEQEMEEEEEPAPDETELFDLIYSISQQQENEWNRRQYEKRLNRVKINDPYNTAFNNREIEINYDNVGELPMNEKYTLTTVESVNGSENNGKRSKAKGHRERRHFHI